MEGLDCPDCAASLEKAVAAMPGVAVARLSYAAFTVEVPVCPPGGPRERINGRCPRRGYRWAAAMPLPPGAHRRADPGDLWQIHQRSVRDRDLRRPRSPGILLSTLGGANSAPEAAFLLGIAVGGFFTARSALFALRAAASWT